MLIGFLVLFVVFYLLLSCIGFCLLFFAVYYWLLSFFGSCFRVNVFFLTPDQYACSGESLSSLGAVLYCLLSTIGCCLLLVAFYYWLLSAIVCFLLLVAVFFYILSNISCLLLFVLSYFFLILPNYFLPFLPT